MGLGCVIFCAGAKAASCITVHHYVTRGIVCGVPQCPVASVPTLAYDDIHPRLYLHYLPLCFIPHTFGNAATTRGFHLTSIQPSSILHLADKIVKHSRRFGGRWNS